MRLIDADRMQMELVMINERSNIFAAPFAGRIKRFIDRQPTVEERKHGHWIKLFDPNHGIIGLECSICEGEMSRETEYCPYCGALMIPRI